MTERVLEFEEALAEVLRRATTLARPAAMERASIREAAGRVLASAVRAERDQPPFARSTRDGWAVRAGDVEAGRALRIVGSVRAGEQWRSAEMGAGEAIEIMTGAPVPAGADAVLMVEHATVAGDGLLQAAGARRLQPGENVVAQGAEARAGAELVSVGHRLGAAEIALAASCGYAQMEVFAKPRVAIVATGDELVELDAALERYQIRNSNSYALAALVREEGGEPQQLPVARDAMDDLRRRIATGREADLLLLSGGVSMGKYDLVEQALREAGAEFFFTGAWIQPGKPVVFGRLRRQGPGIRDQGSGEREWVYFFGLPGNPVSTEVCFRLFVATMLRALAGQTKVAPRFVEARLSEEVQGGARVTRFLPAEVESDWQAVSVRVVPWQGSGDLAANARANGFVVLPGGMERFAVGDAVRMILR